MNQIRGLSTTATRSYKAYKAPKVWSFNQFEQHFGKRFGKNSWGRNYHHGHGPWGYGFNHRFHHHHRGGIFGYLFVGAIGYWFGYHANPEGWEKRHKEKFEKWNKNKDEWWNSKWEHSNREEKLATSEPKQEKYTNSRPESSNSSTYGLWKS